MNRKKWLVLLGFVLICNFLIADKYAGEIFRMGMSVRNFALGNCGLTDFNSSALAYWNPALLEIEPETKFELMHSEEYAGLLTYDTLSGVFGKQRKFSFALSRIGIDDIPLTKLNEETLRPYAYKSVNNADIVAYFGFSRKIFGVSCGFSPKLAYRSLAEHSGYGFGADFALYYPISKKVHTAINIRDFFTTQILWENGSHEVVNPSIDTEMNFQFIFPLLQTKAIWVVGSNCYTEDRDYASTVRIGFFSLDFHSGLELETHPNFDLLFGYDVENLTSGISFSFGQWQVDYGFKYNTELDNSHRLSLSYHL